VDQFNFGIFIIGKEFYLENKAYNFTRTLLISGNNLFCSQLLAPLFLSDGNLPWNYLTNPF